MNRESIDKVFQKLAIAMFSGGLGPTVYMVKVKRKITVCSNVFGLFYVMPFPGQPCV